MDNPLFSSKGLRKLNTHAWDFGLLLRQVGSMHFRMYGTLLFPFEQTHEAVNINGPNPVFPRHNEESEIHQQVLMLCYRSTSIVPWSHSLYFNTDPVITHRQKNV